MCSCSMYIERDKKKPSEFCGNPFLTGSYRIETTKMVERDTKTYRAALRQKVEGGNGLGVVD